MANKRASDRHGFILVDKPRGPTSHDIVLAVRRAFSHRSAGHAGTLDPMATGLLIVAVGEATKLLQFLSADDKEYKATIVLGSETDTLDADGRVVATAPIPDDLSRECVQNQARSFIGSNTQRPPVISAIKKNGVPLYRRAYRGERVEPPLREVVVKDICIKEVRSGAVDLTVRCGRGFYMRSLARDLAAALGTVGHLSALRRTRIGAFTVESAVAVKDAKSVETVDAFREALRERMIPLADGCGGMKRLTLSEEGCEDAFHGRPIPACRIRSGALSEVGREHVALFNGEQKLIAIGRTCKGELRVVRGFRY
jgi:tRNA pseudouridine55 synthase